MGGYDLGMASEQDITKRLRPWQFSMAFLLIFMTTVAILVVFHRLAFIIAAALLAGVWTGIHSPAAVGISVVLFSMLVWFASRVRRSGHHP